MLSVIELSFCVSYSTKSVCALSHAVLTTCEIETIMLILQMKKKTKTEAQRNKVTCSDPPNKKIMTN